MAKHDLTTILGSMLEDIPQVHTGKHLNHTNFLVGNKVFVFIQGESVVLKLPKERAKELLDKKQASQLVMGKRAMKEWVVITHQHPEEYQQDEKLFKEAIAFVSSIQQTMQ
jgi:hypothetical protein